VGSLVGNFLAGRIYQRTLKRIFAVFLVVMAGYILVRQAPRVFPQAFGQPHPEFSSISRAAFGTNRMPTPSKTIPPLVAARVGGVG
jgi:uncharacterized membrane protein YfcA